MVNGIAQKELEQIIDIIVKDTFTRISIAYELHKESDNNRAMSTPKKGESRLVFPSYYKNGEKNGTRISEQELRFAFVEAFNDYCDNHKETNLFYSIETPTQDTYSGFSKKPIINRKSGKGKGRSAEFDLVIYDQHLNRVCLIEFKANNASKTDHDKDLLKLNNETEGREKDTLRYFIEVIKSYSETNEGKNDTIKSLREKFYVKSLKNRIKKDCKIDIGDFVKVYCYALEGCSNNPNGKKDISAKLLNTDLK